MVRKSLGTTALGQGWESTARTSIWYDLHQNFVCPSYNTTSHQNETP